MRRSFNQSYYDIPIQQWEDERIPQIVRRGTLTWVLSLGIPAVIVALLMGASMWRLQAWIGFAVLVFLAAQIFVFFEELNENIRYVRNQIAGLRAGIHAVRAMADKFSDPNNLTVADLARTLDDRWYPEP